MQQELISQWNELAKTAYDRLRELGEINARVTQRLTQLQQEVLNANVQAGMRSMQLVAGPRGQQEFLAGQAAIVSEYNQRALEAGRRAMEILMEARNEYAAWVERGQQAARELAQTAQSGSGSASGTGGTGGTGGGGRKRS
jgi:hypothetical protein